MKSTKRPPKPQSKLKHPSLKLEQTPDANQLEEEFLNLNDEPIELTRNAQEAINIILRSDHGAADDSAQSPKAQRASKPRVENSEYFEWFQHVRFLDRNEPISRIVLSAGTVSREYSVSILVNL